MRQAWVITLATVLATMATAAPAAAQPARRAGLTMGAPATAGVLWHISERVAIRPEVTVSRSSTESNTTIVFPGNTQVLTTTSTGWGMTTGLSGLLYFPTTDRLRLYVAPRAAYIRSTSESESPSGISMPEAFATRSNGVTASGSFGAQYGPHDRFGIFGELGVAYSRQTTKAGPSASRLESELRTFGLRSTAGVILYF